MNIIVNLGDLEFRISLYQITFSMETPLSFLFDLLLIMGIPICVISICDRTTYRLHIHHLINICNKSKIYTSS